MEKIKKVSVVSIESVKIKSARLTKHWEGVQIEDRFYYVHILFLLLGLMHFLPFTFFITANAYWMEKFRNVSADSTDASQRTTLQSHFASGVTITNSVTNSIFMAVSAIFGHRFAPRSRVLWTLACMTTCFIICTLFVEIHTDSWQTLFFYVTFAVLATLNSANAILATAVLTVLAKFPPHYMKFYLFGEGCSAVFDAMLQILTLAVGTSTMTSALIYFLVGTMFMGVTFLLFLFSSKNKYYRYFVEHFENEETRNMMSLSEIKHALRILWPLLLMYMCYDLIKTPQNPITSLVVSEYYGNGNPWNDVYFVPVITFLFGDICTLLGRVASSATLAPKPIVSIMISVGRIFVFVPALLLINAQPRNHLPVLLNHDWEYILVQGSVSFSTGYLFNVLFLSIHNLMVPEKVEDGYLVMVMSICIIGALLSPLASICVDLL